MTDKLPELVDVFYPYEKNKTRMWMKSYTAKSVNEWKKAIADRLVKIHNLWEDAIQNNSKSSYVLAKQEHIELIKELRGAK